MNYTYAYTATVISNGTTSTYDVTTHTPTNKWFFNTGIVVSQKLAANSSATNYSYTATKHRGYLQYTCQITNSSTSHVSAVALYSHQESTVSVSPSVSLSGDLSISVTPSTKFKLMDNNPKITFP